MGLLSDNSGEARSINWVLRDPLAFLVRFVQMELDKQTPGEWMDLRWQLSRFTDAPRQFGPIPVVFMATDFGHYQDDKELALYRFLQQRLREVVEDFVSPVKIGLHPPPLLLNLEGIVDGEDAGVVRVDVQTGLDQVPGGVVMILYAPVAWIAWLQAQVVLQADGQGRVRQCPQCKSYFIKVRRQKFCSTRCTNKASMAAYLAKRENLQKHRDSSHRTYAKKKRAATRQNVKIGRQPRKGR